MGGKLDSIQGDGVWNKLIAWYDARVDNEVQKNIDGGGNGGDGGGRGERGVVENFIIEIKGRYDEREDRLQFC